ncbi:MAG: YbfB/YjiJ family MFS transporter [Rhodobacterales bacterium]|nr:YbfB/YjiJ family MFS transporter [Rhodobacterales bacterium]
MEISRDSSDHFRSTITQWFILLGLVLGVTVTNSFARFTYGLMLPAMQTEMNWNYMQAGWLGTINALGYIVGAVFTMLLVQKFPSKYLFAAGLISTSVTLFLTGILVKIEFQLASTLFQDDHRMNALSIAILFGTGGGLGIVISGAIIPLLIDFYGNSFWPICWVIIGVLCVLFCPVGIWSVRKLPRSNLVANDKQKIPIRSMYAIFTGYASFGLGYIVYLTFISAWMVSQQLSALSITSVWVILGLCICISPFFWKPIFARFDDGTPLSLILVTIAAGSSIPVLFPSFLGLIVSAVIFGLSVFMAPGAITNFTRKNLHENNWAYSISVFTIIFALAQTIGPFAAGVLGDWLENIGASLLIASMVMMIGAFCAYSQKGMR